MLVTRGFSEKEVALLCVCVWTELMTREQQEGQRWVRTTQEPEKREEQKEWEEERKRRIDSVSVAWSLTAAGFFIPASCYSAITAGASHSWSSPHTDQPVWSKTPSLETDNRFPTGCYGFCGVCSVDIRCLFGFYSLDVSLRVKNLLGCFCGLGNLDAVALMSYRVVILKYAS